ncbi:endonuclease V [Candidatus Bipolaricaulota bacterium]|nr:endonuclease V [Candidatus Bipolaricaulota bacterium]
MPDSADLRAVPELDKIILETLLQVPTGKLTTYKDIAVALGDERAARAVGTVMAGNPYPNRFPCWKVVHTSGDVGKYSGDGGREEKIRRMEGEGIDVKDGHVVDFETVRFHNFCTDKPLERLRSLQLEVSRRYKICPLGDGYSGKSGGVDLSYGDGLTTASYVEFIEGEEEPIYEKTITRDKVGFPYIPGYLSFRELPVLLDLLEMVSGEHEVASPIFVDGNGELHPRRAGLATHLGVVLDQPTIGVAKSLLCGEVSTKPPQVGDRSLIRVGGKVLGCSVKTYSPANPIYVSIGHNVTREEAVDLVFRFSRFKLPEPVRIAHKNAKKLATASY